LTGCRGSNTDFIREWRQGAGKAIKGFVLLAFEVGEAFRLDWSKEGDVVGGIYYRAQVAHMVIPPTVLSWLPK